MLTQTPHQAMIILNIPAYNMSHDDHLSGNLHGGVHIYYKNSFPIKMLNINFFQECICFDLKNRKQWLYYCVPL